MAASKVAKESIYKLGHEIIKSGGMGLQTLGNVISRLESPGSAYKRALESEDVWGEYNVSPETSDFYGGITEGLKNSPRGRVATKVGGDMVNALGEVARKHPEGAMQAMGMLAISDVIPGFNKMSAPIKKGIKDAIEGKIDDVTLTDLHTLHGEVASADTILGVEKFRKQQFDVPLETKNLETMGDRMDKRSLEVVEQARAKTDYAVPVVHQTPREINTRGLGGGRRGTPYVALQEHFQTGDADLNYSRMQDLSKAAIGQTNEHGDYNPVGGRGDLSGALNAYKKMQDNLDEMKSMRKNYRKELFSGKTPTMADQNEYNQAHFRRARDVEGNREFYDEAMNDAEGVKNIPMWAKRGILGHVEDPKDRAIQMLAIEKGFEIPDGLDNLTMAEIFKYQKKTGEFDVGGVARAMEKGEIPSLMKSSDFMNNQLSGNIDRPMREHMNRARNYTIEDMYNSQMGNKVRDSIWDDAPSAVPEGDAVEALAERFRPYWDDAEAGSAQGRVGNLARYMNDAGFTGMRVGDEMDGLSVAILHPDNLRHRNFGFK